MKKLGVLIGLVFWGSVLAVPVKAASNVALQYSIDRSAVPTLYYNDITLKIYVGTGGSVTAKADSGTPTVKFDATTGYALVTTSGKSLEVDGTGVTTNAQTGTYSKAVLRDDKQWAWSFSFDDNQEFKATGLPAFYSCGGRVTVPTNDPTFSCWRGSVYLIGSKIDETRDENWIIDKPDILRLIQKGWGIGNHTWSHDYYKNTGTSDITQLDTFLKTIVAQSVHPNYVLTAFAAPMFDTDYLPVIISLRNSKTTNLLFDESKDDYVHHVDPGAAGDSVGVAFTFDKEIGRDWSIQAYKTGSSDDTTFQARVNNVVTHASDTAHYWFNTFGHGVDLDPTGTGVRAFIPWLYDNYGPGGKNNVWVAPADEIYSYLEVREKTIIKTASGPTLTPIPTTAVKPGDANNDGKVDGVDYAIWLVNYGSTTATGPIQGDFNGDHKTDGVDYTIWLLNYGS